jgi:AraC family transcriptional regulator
MVDCVVPPGFRIRDHGHDAPHLCLVLEGGFRQTVNGEERGLAPGSVRVSPRSARHDLVAGSAGARLLVVHPESPAVPFPRPAILARERTQSLGERVREDLEAEWPSPLRLEEAADELLAPRVGSRGAIPAWLEEVRERLDSRESLPVDRLAREAGVHRVHLSRAFRSHFGCPISAYVLRRRLDHAWTLLRDSDRGLAAISDEAGFSDQSHLTRAFSRTFAAPPGAYRRLAPARPVWGTW